jgi:hypothetical protein
LPGQQFDWHEHISAVIPFCFNCGNYLVVIVLKHDNIMRGINWSVWQSPLHLFPGYIFPYSIRTLLGLLSALLRVLSTLYLLMLCPFLGPIRSLPFFVGLLYI